MRAAILLAAGGSRRFGTRNKLLAPLKGRPLIAWALAAAAAAPAGRLIVVTGADRARVTRTVRRWAPAARIVPAPRWREGLAASLARGLSALRPIERAAFVFLGDMPDVPARLAHRLARAAGRGAVAVRAVQGGRPGHPVLVSTRFARAALRKGDTGLGRAIAALPPGRRIDLPADRRATRDIDRPADLRMRAYQR